MERLSACRTWLFALFLVSLGLLPTGCGTSTTINALRLSTDNLNIAAGSTTQLHATFIETSLDATDATSMVTWSTSDPTIATVSSSGLLTGMAAGPVVVSAVYKYSTGSLNFIIGAPPVTSLRLSPQNASVFTNSTQQYTAMAAYANNTTGNASSAVQWAVVPANVATISATGLLTATAPGSYAVTASTGAQSAVVTGSVGNAPLASLAVTPANPTLTAGTTQQFTATGTGTNQSTSDLTASVTWTSSNPAVLSIAANGLATTYTGITAATTVTVTATTGGFSATATVQVNPAIPTAFYVVPTSSSIANTTAETHHALAFYADGSQRDVSAAAQWSFASSTPGAARPGASADAHADAGTTTVATVDNTGTDTAVTPGMAMLQASFGTMQAQSTVIVTSATATALIPSSSNTVFQAGATQQVNLIGVFSDGRTQDITLNGNWKSLNPAVATIASNGLVTGVSAGTVQFTASFEGLTATTPLFHIVPAGLSSILTVVESPFIVNGRTQKLTVMGVYNDGSMQDITQLATWQSTDPTVVSIDSNGVADCIKGGSVQVTATIQGFSSTRTIVVTPAKLLSIQVLPPVSAFAQGTSSQLTALATFSDGATVNLTSGVIWSSTDTTVFTIDALGVAKSGKIGTAKASATLVGVTGTSTSTSVYAATLKTIKITPSAGQIAATTSKALTAKGIFADGSIQDITGNVTWSSSNTTVATVDAAGLLQGNAPGTSLISATLQGITASTTLKVSNAALASVALAPPSSTLALITSRQLNFIGTFTDGTTQVLNNEAVWSVDNPFSVDAYQGGLVLGVAVGSGTVTAQLGHYVASAFVNVTNATLSSMAFAPVPATLPVGLSQQYSVIGTFSDGSTQDLATNLQCVSSNPTVASIDSNQVVTATTIGTAQIACTFQGKTTVTTPLQVIGDYLSSIAITPANASVASGASQQFTATGSYPDGSTLDLSGTVNWSSSDPATLAIDNNGLATANNNTGLTKTVTLTAQINAQSGSITSSVTMQVTSVATLTALAVIPTSSSIANGTSESHTALAWYSDGSEKDVTNEVTWSVPGAPADNAIHGATHRQATGTVATVNAAGVDQAISPGTTAVQAVLGSMTSQSVVIVTPATVTAINIRASGDLFQAGSDQQVQLIGTFSDGTHQDLSLSGNWQSSNPAVATISSSGLAHGVSAGPVVFSASFGGLTASTIGFQVLPPTLLSITVGIDYPSLPIGVSENARVTGTYSDGTTHDLTPLATWTSGDPTIMPVDSAGMVHGLSPGVTQITATVQGKSAILNVATISLTLVSIEILPAQPAFALATTLDFTALGIFSNGASVDITKGVIWRSANPAVLTIDGLGRAKAGTVGSTTVSATLLGVTQVSNPIQVTSATLATLHITAPKSQLAKLTGQQYTATGIFNDGSFQDLTADVIWNTTDNTTASIDSTGLGIGMKPGTVDITATFQGKTVSTPLTVSAATLVSTTLSPGAPELPVGITRQFSLIGNFSDGTTQDLSYFAIWQAPTPLIVDVLLQGQAVGASPGIGEISAQYGYFSASSPVLVTDATLSSISITPPSATARLGSQTQVVANGTFSDGFVQDLVQDVTFSSDTPSVATVSRSGLVSATGLGSATIAATFQGKTATMTSFQVVGNTLTAIAVTPSSVNLALGATQQLTATGTYADGTTANVSGIVQWTSSNPAILNVDENGLATAFTTPITLTSNAAAAHGLRPFASGATTAVSVTAQSGSAIGNATVTVPSPGSIPAPAATLTALTVEPTSSRLAAGTTGQLHAIGTYSDGTSQDLTTAVTWTSTNTALATIAATGIATGVATGLVTLQAQSGSLQSNAVLVVTAATLTSVAISSSGASFPAGVAQQFTLNGTFSDGSTQNLNSSATWTTSNSNVATVSSTGLVTGVAPGSVQLTATAFGQTATSPTVQVTSATLSSIAVTPANPVVADGTGVQFRVLGTFSDGTTQDLTALTTYTSSNPAVATVSATGLATGLSAGPSQITIAAGGQTVTLTLTVTSATLASLAITPQTPVFADNTTQQFSVLGTFSDGSTQDLTSQAVWISSNPQVFTINQNGLATGGNPGTGQVSATFDGTTATTGSVQVTSATLVSLALTPTTAQIAKGTAQQFTVTGTFSDGTTQNLSTEATWTSSNGSIGSIDANGLAIGTGVGSAQLTAAFQGKTVSTTSFTVTAATLVSIAFSPANPTLAKGTAEPVAVIGTFSDSSTQDLTSQTAFTSSNPAVATVTTTGVVTGVSPGTSTITAQVNGLTGSYTVTVSGATLASIAIAPSAPASFAKGTTQQFTATGTFSDGTTQNLTSSVTWTSSNSAVVTVNGNGLATGTGVGTAQLTATDLGQTATTQSFQVASAVIESLAVTPTNPAIAPGNTQQFTATATYSDGTTQNVTNATTWTSSSTGVATIAASGLATAVAPGTTTVTGQSSSFAGSITLLVTPSSAPIASIAVTPANRTLAPGATQQYTATATYTDSTTQNVTNAVAWSSSNGSAATISASGLAAAAAQGTTSIAAQLNGHSGSANLTVTAVTLASIAITPTSANLAKGSTQQFTAIGTYTDGTTQNLTTQVAWSSSVPAVASIAANGLASSLGIGSTQISGSLQGQSNAVTLTVGPAVWSSIAVTPASATVASGTTQQYKAVATMTDGSTQDLTASATWSSSNTAVATVNAAGLASTSGTGTTTIDAQAGTSPVLTGSATLSVTAANAVSIQLSPSLVSLPVGGSLQLLATASFTDGSSQTVTSSAAYGTSNAAVVTVDGNGDLHATGTGTATVTATLGAASTSINVTVSNATLASIAITPATLTLAAGTSQQLTATGTFTDGSTQDLTAAVTWSSSAPSVASVSSTGYLVLAQAGSATITATSGGISGSAAITGSAATVIAIAVSPASISLANGQMEQFAATATLSDGTQQTVTASAQWSVSDPTKATVGNSAGTSGLFTAKAPGVVSVAASLNSISGSAAVTILSATLTSIAVTPSPLSLAAGTTQTLTVTGTYSDGTTANLTTGTTWATSNASAATVSPTGLLDAIAAGSATITATVQGVSGTVPVTVTAATLQSVAITPATPSLAAGLHTQLTATGTYSDGTTANLTALVQWSSSAPAVATVSSTGLANALTAGSATLTATFQGTSTQIPITVTAATLQSIAVQASQTSFALGLSLPLHAIGTYSDGTTQDLTSTVAWSSQTPSVGVVSASGLATGVTTGTFNARASYNGVTGSLALTVSSPVLQSIVVTPAHTLVVEVLGSVQYTATGHYSDGSTQNITDSVTWSLTSVLSIGSISQTGTFSPVAVGVGTVTATSGAISGSTGVTVVQL